MSKKDNRKSQSQPSMEDSGKVDKVVNTDKVVKAVKADKPKADKAKNEANKDVKPKVEKPKTDKPKAEVVKVEAPKVEEPSSTGDYVNCSLYDIDASRNIRRACPKLSNQNLDPYTLIQEMVLVDNEKLHLEFVRIISQEAKIVTLAHSILKFGQIHPVTVVANPDAGRKYINVAGQRRYIAAALAEALIRLKGNTDLFAQALNILAQVKAEGDADAGLDLSFDEFITSKDQIFEIKAQVAKLSIEQAEDISFEENDETLQMSDLDWGYQFDIMLKSINPQTGKAYTLQDIAKKRKKHYLFVRGRAALPYLPTAWKEKLDEGSISVTKAIEKALALKHDAESKVVQKHFDPFVPDVEQEQLKPTGTGATLVEVEINDDIHDAMEVDINSATATLEGFESAIDDDDQLDMAEKEHGQEEDQELKNAEKKKTRKKKSKPDIRISVADIMRKIIDADRSNGERIKAFAEVIQLSFDEALLLNEDDIALHS